MRCARLEVLGCARSCKCCVDWVAKLWAYLGLFRWAVKYLLACLLSPLEVRLDGGLPCLELLALCD